MNKQIVTFTANEQSLVKTGGICAYASNIVDYIEAQFTLGDNWGSFTSVYAVWYNDFKSVSAVLDSDGVCIVPHEVLASRGKVNVNLVGTIIEDETITDRLTTFPIEAFVVTKVARVNGSEPSDIPSSGFSVSSPITYTSGVLGFDGYTISQDYEYAFEEVCENYSESQPYYISEECYDFFDCDSLRVSYDGTTYVCQKVVYSDGVNGYGATWNVDPDTADFSEFPFLILSEYQDETYATNYLYSDTEDDHTYIVERLIDVASVSDDFALAVNTQIHLTNLVNGSAEGSVRGTSTAEEDDDYTMGIGAFAEGSGTKASGDYGSHAEGTRTVASGTYAHAEGLLSEATAMSSHAEGHGTTASNSGAHAEGWGGSASGSASHAEGYQCSAAGANSHAEGCGTTANHRAQHVFGEYNVIDSSSAPATSRGNYVEIVGNGTYSYPTTTRSNARTLDWRGNEALAGSITLGAGTENEVTLTPENLQALLNLLIG